MFIVNASTREKPDFVESELVATLTAGFLAMMPKPFVIMMSLLFSTRLAHKTSLRGFRRNETQPSLLSYRNFACSKFRYDTFQTLNNKDAVQSERMLRLVCTFGVHTPRRQIFSRRCQIFYLLSTNYMLRLMDNTSESRKFEVFRNREVDIQCIHPKTDYYHFFLSINNVWVH